MIFYKTVASGNDFLHINMADYIAHYSGAGIPEPSGVHRGPLVRELCSRHTGAGADGTVFYSLPSAPSQEVVTFEIFNRDGSEAELSGNGMAGLAALLFFLGKFSHQVTFATRVGRRTHTLLHQSGNLCRLTIEIGAPDFEAGHFFPFLKKEQAAYSCAGITFYPVSVGNPHVVVRLDAETPDHELEKIGGCLEQHAMFPHKTNVEFVVPVGTGATDYEQGRGFRVYFYERGVGRTLASSTGSAAVFAVLQKLGLLQHTLRIPPAPATILPRSSISMEKTPPFTKISGKDNIFIESSAKIVYNGIYLNQPT